MLEWFSLGNVIVPIMVLLIIISFFAVMRIMARNYLKVPPNQLAVIFGRKYKYRASDGSTQTRGFRLVSGGAAFIIPLLEHHKVMSLDAFQIETIIKSAPSSQGVRVTVSAVSSLKIGKEETMLEAAASRFLDQGPQQIEEFCKSIVAGGLRGVVATMTVEELVKERTKFGNKVQEDVAGELQKIGLNIDNFIIQEISDDQGYIDALGKKQTAGVKRDAAIAEAEATRDQNISVAEALRESDQKSSEARRAGEKAKAEAEQQISDVSQLRDVTIAQNTALVQAEQTKIKIAADIAAAQKNKELRIAQVEAEQAEVEARTKLQEKEHERKDAELKATIVVQAEREKEAAITTADGAKEAARRVAEGERIKIEQAAEAGKKKSELEGEGVKLRQTAEADGRKAAATALQAEKEAEAKGNQAKLEAEAEGTKAKLLAEAEGIKAKLTAEAEGIEKKAEAYQKLDQAGKLLLILEHLPKIIESLGKAIKEAGEGTLAPMAQAIGTGLAGVEEIRLTDFGGASGRDGIGSDVLSRFTGTIPDVVFNLLAKAQAMGMGEKVAEIGKQFGFDFSSLFGGNAQSVSLASSTEPTANELTAAPVEEEEKINNE
ncbi:MAG: SPFH domain-containing protein [bacterium]|nr:SPFH domain-containing protein [bacterium]